MTSDVESLEKLCFNYILNKFSYFLSCHHSTENEILKKNSLFLKRAYTQQLFSQLKDNDKLDKEYLDFLLNDHLRELDIAPLVSHLTEEEILAKVIPIAHNLQELSYTSRSYVHSIGVSVLEKLFPHSTRVKKVVVPYNCNDRLLGCIASSCPDLIELDIRHSSVTGKGIEHLFFNSNGLIQAKCSLKILNLWNTLLEFKDDVLIEAYDNFHQNLKPRPPLELIDAAFLLKYMPTLEEVIYYKLPSVIESLYSLNRNETNHQKTVKYNLLSLDFSEYDLPSEITRALTVCTETCPKLKTLNAKYVKPHDLNIICSFSNLENLVLGRSWDYENTVCVNGLLVLIGKKLKHLTLHSFSLSVSVLMENCPNLEILSLDRVTFQNLNQNLIKPLKLLDSLVLDSMGSSVNAASVMKLLYSSPKLDNLIFISYKFDEINMKELVQFFLISKLRHLQFLFCNVKCTFLQELIVSKSSLRHLSLSYCEDVGQVQYNILDQIIKESKRNIRLSFKAFYDTEPF